MSKPPKRIFESPLVTNPEVNRIFQTELSVTDVQYLFSTYDTETWTIFCMDEIFLVIEKHRGYHESIYLTQLYLGKHQYWMNYATMDDFLAVIKEVTDGWL